MNVTIDCELQRTGGTTTGFHVPDEVVDKLGGGRRPKVVATVNGRSWRSSIASMGGEFWLGVSAANRNLVGLSGGEVYELTLELDTAPREVDVPDDLAQALAEAGARPAFDRLSFTLRKEHALAVTSAKRTETRERRIEKIVAGLTP